MTRIAQLHWLPIESPSNGMEGRIRKTAERLADFGEVVSIYPCESPEPIDGGIRRYPLDNPLLRHKRTRIELWYAFLSLGGTNPYHWLQTALTNRSIRQIDAEFDLVVSEAPQMTPAAFDLAEKSEAPVLLNKHNATYVLLEQLLADHPIPRVVRRRAVRTLQRQEQQAIERADAVIFQSDADRQAFSVPENTLTETIPNGTKYDTIRAGGDPGRVRERHGLSDNGTHVVFVGSYDYLPNQQAAEVIVERFAPALPHLDFLLVGRNPPSVPERENVHAVGFVEDLPGVLSVSDIALCPLTRGRGTKLKMMDYLAAGLPVVATSIGADGIDVVDGESAIIRDDFGKFTEAIARLGDDEELRSMIGTEAKRVGEKYAWSNVLEGYGPVIDSLLSTERRIREPIPVAQS